MATGVAEDKIPEKGIAARPALPSAAQRTRDLRATTHGGRLGGALLVGLTRRTTYPFP